ncbi:MAG TPA: TetR/AcrR family transcriptional regulator [Solirubrobacteraceae bacterium]
MPRTRTQLQREAKVEEIAAAAAERLRERGYDGLSVVGVARDLGLAQNAVYWYFPSKDHLFVAALERMLREIHARKPPPQRALEKKVLFFVEQLDALADVRAAMYDRARVSPVVAEFVEQLDALWRRMLTNVLRDKVPPGELEPTVDTLLATFQGALLRPHAPDDLRRTVRYALRRLVG